MRTIASLALSVAWLTIAPSALANPTAAGYLEGWDVPGDLAGWGPNTVDSNVIHAAAGGNPDGHLVSRRSGPFDIGFVTELDALTGDYTGQAAWTAMFDLNYFEGDFTDAWLRFRFQDATQNGWRIPVAGLFPEDTWTTYSVTFNPLWTDVEAHAAGWLTDMEVDPAADPSVSFATLLGDVFTTEVRVAGTSTSLLVGLDNFKLVPEPGTALLVMVGVLGLSASRRRRAN